MRLPQEPDDQLQETTISALISKFVEEVDSVFAVIIFDGDEPLFSSATTSLISQVYLTLTKTLNRVRDAKNINLIILQ